MVYNILLSEEILTKTIFDLNNTVKGQVERLLGLAYHLGEYCSDMNVVDYWDSHISYDILQKLKKNEFYILKNDDIKLYPIIQLSIDSPLGINLIFAYDSSSSLNINYTLVGITIDAKIYNKVVQFGDEVRLIVCYSDDLFYIVIDEDDMCFLNESLFITQYDINFNNKVEFVFCLSGKKRVSNFDVSD